MITILLFAFIQNAAVIGISFILGGLFQNGLSIRSRHPLFNWGFQITTGLVILTSVFAAYKTHGSSQFLGMLLSLAFLLIWMKYFNKERNDALSNSKMPNAVILKDALFVVYATFVATLAQVLLVYVPSIHALCPPTFDWVFYANCSKYIGLMHCENSFHYAASFSNCYSGYSPYHYFELWMGNFFSGFNGQSHFNAIYTNANAVIIASIVVLLGGIIQMPSKWLKFILPLLLCPTVYFAFDLSSKDAIASFVSYFSCFNPITHLGQKFLPWVPFSIIAFQFWIEKKYQIAAFFFALLVFVSVTATFLVLGFLSLYLLHQLIFEKRGWAIAGDAVIGLVPLFFFFLFNHFAKKPPVELTIVPSLLGQFSHFPNHFILLSHIAGKALCQFTLTFGAFYLIVFAQYRKISVRQLFQSTPMVALVLSIGAASASLLGFVFFFDMPDAEQFFESSSVIVSSLFVVLALNDLARGRYLLAVLVLCISSLNLVAVYKSTQERVGFFGKHEVVDFQKSFSKLPNDSNFVVANFNVTERYKSIYSISTLCNIPLELIRPGKEDLTQIIDLTVNRAESQVPKLISPYAPIYSYNLIKSSIWYTYLRSKGIAHPASCSEEELKKLRFQFITDKHISYLYVADTSDIQNAPFKLRYLTTNKLNNKRLYKIDKDTNPL